MQKEERNMSIKLRQICLVAEELAPIVDDLKAVFDLEIGFIDEGVGVFGLENALLPIGTSFLEVVAPVKDGTAAGRFLERRKGNGGYMVITEIQSKEDQEQARKRAEGLNVRVAWEHAHKTGHFMQLHPADVGGSFFEIDHVAKSEVADFWPPAGGTGWQDNVRTNIISEIRGVELQSDDPKNLAARWSTIAGHPITRDAENNHILSFASGFVRFVELADDRGPGLSAVDVTATDLEKAIANAKNRRLPTTANQVTICGTRFNLSEP